ITWVEGRIQKHRDLGTDHIVLVSKSGFTKAARKKAQQHGAMTLTVEQATEADWTSLPRVGIAVHRMELRRIGIEVPYEAKLDVEVPAGGLSLFSESADPLQTMLYTRSGTRLGTVKDILENAKSAPLVTADFERRAPQHGNEAPLAFKVRFSPG